MAVVSIHEFSVFVSPLVERSFYSHTLRGSKRNRARPARRRPAQKFSERGAL
jgi:hypothetical protein